MAELKPARELRQESDEALAKPVLDYIAELIEGNKHRKNSILVDAHAKGPQLHDPGPL